jgi:TPR repeat protein
MLTGKSVRTVQRWISDGEIPSIPSGSEQTGTNVTKAMLDITSLASHIPIPLTDDTITAILRAESGEVEGMNSVGLYFYEAGQYKIAVVWFDAAAKKGHADAMEWLSICYINGTGVEKNHALGVQWLGKAAALGHLIAKVKLQALGFEA